MIKNIIKFFVDLDNLEISGARTGSTFGQRCKDMGYKSEEFHECVENLKTGIKGMKK